MARHACVSLPGIPHHLTERGNGRRHICFGNADHPPYRDVPASSCEVSGVEVCARAPMPNPVHVILVVSHRLIPRLGRMLRGIQDLSDAGSAKLSQFQC
jgi:putative transposase